MMRALFLSFALLTSTIAGVATADAVHAGSPCDPGKHTC
jgi:hypothetical protein